MTMKNYHIITTLWVSILLWSCTANKPWISQPAKNNSQNIALSNIDYELYLVGNIGAASNNLSQVDIVELIKSQLKKDGIKRSVVFMGNSFSESGIPDTETAEFQKIDLATEKCIKLLKDVTDKVYFIPGDGEWYDGHDYTVSALQHVEDYIEDKVGGKNVFSPSNGCGEPQVVELTEDLILLLMDSQWILQGDDSDERKRSGCEIDNELELVTYLQQVLAKNKNKNVIITAHHPVYSNGKAGGNYGVASHLLPLPVLGSIITGVKKISGGKERFGHPQYEAYRAAMNLTLSNFEGVIHASAHDQNLQYHNKNQNHFVVAGSGSDIDFVRKGGTADFAAMKQGFAKITHTKDLELWLEFYIADDMSPTKAKSVYKKLLYKKEPIDYSDKTVYKDAADYPKEVKVAASTTYAQGKFGMGQTYRAEWGTEINAPVLLLDGYEGGLKPVQQGGGFQTKSLRLENPEGRQWVVRTIDKDVTKVVPPALRNTFAQNLVQDGISAAHPYAAFAIPLLAEAAKIYHANPRFVWLPKQKSLGDYNTDFADRLYLFEERPGGNMQGHPNYGGAKKSINTPELVEKLLKNHKHTVDQQYVLRARLFDLLIGDWDRHDDQWRWGVYESDQYADQKIYRAIPRDRDQAFFKNDGFMNFIASRPFFSPQLRKFDEKIDYINGLAFNARHFDRHFLSQLNEADFIRIAEELQRNVTDDIIESAIRSWPKEVFDKSGLEIINKLKQRRTDLLTYAREFYKFLTKEVSVIGTYGKNKFEIEALSGDQMKVKVYHMDEGQNHLIWSRIINGKDCEELRLFGLKKSDQFIFTGQHESSIMVRIVGGSGEDEVINNSTIKVIAYDRPEGMALKGSNIISKLKDQKSVNSFDRKDWKMDRSIHFPMLTFYTDEGIGLSYNIWWQKNGFRKNPYKSNHSLNLGYFWANSAIVAKYMGIWPDALGPSWDMQVDASVSGPTFTQFFYGLGNDYINFEELLPDIEGAGTRNFHIVRGTHFDFNPKAVKDFGNNRSLSINPSIEFYNMDDELNDLTEQRFIFLDEAGRSSIDFESKLYTSIGLAYGSNRVNSPTLPTRGYSFTIGADFKQSLSNSEFTNLTFSSSVAAYIPFSPTHQVVLATHLGGSYTLGEYEFFHANYLASPTRLRGYRTNRFAGDGVVFHATDLRIKLLQGNGGLRSGLGIFGSFDYGRAFLEDESINDWHTSVGGGIYLTPLNMLGFKIGYYVGGDDTQLSIGGALSF